jgi:alkylhydroperoxidase family enzyme
MPWIKTVLDADAGGLLRAVYDAAIKRAGRVFNILRIMSPNPPVLDASIQMYRALMFGASELTRAQRELLAVVVSRANNCHY